jgi:hypothetical protein
MPLSFIPLLLAGFIDPASAPASADSFIPRCVPPNLPARAAASRPVSAAHLETFAAPRSPVVPLSTAAASLLLTATERSPLVNRLLRELGRSDVVVYVTNLKAWDRVGPRSYMTFLARDATQRYLLVRIDHRSLSQAERIALLGHELQHALEVAAAPEVRDIETMAWMFRRIGSEVAQNTFETRGARDVAHLIRRELH